MSTPNPATTPWVPLWNLNGATPLNYRGAYASGTYADGDIVVQNGITYLCVRPTTNPPAPWPMAPGTSSYGTTLPASPYDGQEAVLVDSITNPAYVWRFRYNAGSTSPYKWECVGGSPWVGYTTTNEPTSGGAYWKTNPSPGPLRAGIYACSYWLSANVTPTVAQPGIALDVYLGDGSANFTPNFHRVYSVNGVANTTYSNEFAWYQPLPVTIGAGKTVKFNAMPTNWDWNIVDRAITVIPVRVS